MAMGTFDSHRFMASDPESLAREFYDDPMIAAMPADEEVIALSDQELQSAVWKKITTWIDTRLTELREQNDFTSTPLETEKLRGKIELLKELRSTGLNHGPKDGENHPLPGDDLGY